MVRCKVMIEKYIWVVLQQITPLHNLPQIQMSEKSPLKNRRNEYVNVSVLRVHHDEIQKYLDDNEGGFIGKFYDKSAIEKLYRLIKRNTPFNLLSTETLIKNGWERLGSSTYKRESNVIMYTGVYWYCNGEQLTPDNFREYIGNKMNFKNK